MAISFYSTKCIICNRRALVTYGSFSADIICPTCEEDEGKVYECDNCRDWFLEADRPTNDHYFCEACNEEYEENYRIGTEILNMKDED